MKKLLIFTLIGIAVTLSFNACIGLALGLLGSKNSQDTSYESTNISDELSSETNDLKETSSSVEIETTTVHRHRWEKNCGKTSVCIDCGEDDGVVMEHSTDLGVCEYCNQELRKQSPVTIIGRTWEKDYVGGIQWTFKIRNNTDKTIKYITLQWTCYNAVGDYVYDDIDGDNYVRVKYTGPLEGGETTSNVRNSTKFYNHSYNNSSFSEIIVEYMDGTKEKVTKYHDNIFE